MLLMKKSEELKKKPHGFYKIFMPFLWSKTKCNTSKDIKLMTNDYVSRDPTVIAETMGDYFATIADAFSLYRRQIPGNQESVQAIADHLSVNHRLFKFPKIKSLVVKMLLKEMNPEKSNWLGYYTTKSITDRCQ